MIKYVLFDWGGTIGKSGKRSNFLKANTLKEAKKYILPGKLELLRKLYKAGIPMAIVSNTDKSVNDMINALHKTRMAKYFQFVIHSSEHACKKPCYSIFQRAVDKIQLMYPYITKDEILYVGNNYETDYIGAKNAGIQAHLV
jgi:putative hydrolase of the HAD superfamily